MRLGVIIVALAGISVALVHLRRSEIATHHRLQDLCLREVKLRRTLWDQQIRLGFLTAPEEVRRRARRMCIQLVEKDQPATPTTARTAPRRPRRSATRDQR